MARVIPSPHASWAPEVGGVACPVGTDDLRSMLERIRAIRHACDLDLLLFFNRHPRALLTSEQLVAYLGYDGARVANSLDGLIGAGLLTRSQYPSHAARMYVLELAGVSLRRISSSSAFST